MSYVTINTRRCCYTTVGEGFPLILVPDDQGSSGDWAQQIPLLGELCKVITYAYCAHEHAETLPQPPDYNVRVDELATLLGVLGVERAYVAGYARGGQTALQYALRYPERLEGLLLIGMERPAVVAEEQRPRFAKGSMEARVALPHAVLSTLTIPAVVLVGGEAASHLSWATFLTTQLQRCTRTVIPGAGAAPHREQPLRLGHAMMHFLIHCERQRNLVRGASFLL